LSKIVLTRFFCQELLYDYLQGRLTPERATEVAEFLKTDEVCREDLEHLKRAIGFCEKLARIETPVAWMERWQNLPPALAKRITDWEMKLVSKVWNALPYVVVVLVTGLGLWIFKPWKTFYNREVVVWTAAPIHHEEVKTAAVDAPTPAAVVEVKAKKDDATAVLQATPNAIAQLPPKEEVAKEPVKAAPTPAPPELKPAEEKVAAVVPVPKPKPKPKAKPVVEASQEESGEAEEAQAEPTSDVKVEAEAKPAPEKVAVAETHEKSAAEEAEEDMGTDKSKAGSARGFVYRATMAVGAFEKDSSLIKDKILALGGEKARNAELGWRRKKNESYFHFTLPESNHDQLVHFLSSLGPVRITRDKHPVVMPPGKIRIILVVKESANHGEQETE
jgi:outer membrane biosynthesis protein TonB